MSKAWISTIRPSEWAVTVLRILVGFGFAAHGYAKLARGPEQFAAIVHAMGVGAPLMMAWLVTLGELVSGALAFASKMPLSVDAWLDRRKRRSRASA